MEIKYLTKASVSIRSDTWGYQAYSNSPSGRARLEADNPPEIVAEVLAVWGDSPTLPDPEPPELPDPPPEPQPDPTERIAELEQQVADLTAAIERGISL